MIFLGNHVLPDRGGARLDLARRAAGRRSRPFRETCEEVAVGVGCGRGRGCPAHPRVLAGPARPRPAAGAGACCRTARRHGADRGAGRSATGVAAYAYRGGPVLDRRDFCIGAALIKHPAGDLLADAGSGPDIAWQFAAMPRRFRAVPRYRLCKPAAGQLDAAGDVDPPGVSGGPQTWKDEGSWRHSGNTRRSCGNAR